MNVKEEFITLISKFWGKTKDGDNDDYVNTRTNVFTKISYKAKWK